MRFRVASLSATVRFRPEALLSPPDIIGTTHIFPPQCVKPRGAVCDSPPRAFRTFIFHSTALNRDLSRAQIHLPCRRRRRERLLRFLALFPSLPRPSFLSRHDSPTSRRLYIASGKILPRIREPLASSSSDRETNRFAKMPPAQPTTVEASWQILAEHFLSILTLRAYLL